MKSLHLNHELAANYSGLVVSRDFKIADCHNLLVSMPSSNSFLLQDITTNKLWLRHSKLKKKTELSDDRQDVELDVGFKVVLAAEMNGAKGILYCSD